ncbi:MAG: Ig-like domain-containing protein [Clostridia bacterium]|nr:Ig-like domain-containing protein [Clostridia bacterium]
MSAAEAAERLCPYCSGELPQSADIGFCPYCGESLKSKGKPVKGWIKASFAGLGCLVLLGVLLFAFLMLANGYYQAKKELELGSRAQSVSIVLGGHTGSVYPNDTAKLELQLSPAGSNAPYVTWSSSDESVAAVDKSGMATFFREGVVTFTAKLDNGVEGRLDIEVVKRPSAITFGFSKLNIRVGESTTLEPILLPEDACAESYTWESADGSILSVDENGKVKGKKEGRTTLTVSAGGVKNVLNVFVYRYELDLLSNFLYENCEYDDEGLCYFYELDFNDYSSEGKTSGEGAARYVELRFYPDDNIVVLCCQILDEATDSYYETFLSFGRGNKRTADLYFTMSAAGGGASHTIPLSVRNEVEAATVIYLSDYAPGALVTFLTYTGSEEFRQVSEKLAGAMLSFSIQKLQEKWHELDMPMSVSELLGLEKLK